MNIFQSPIYRDYYCYALHLYLSSIYQKSFSPLFIGIIIVTGGSETTHPAFIIFQSPIYRDYYCYPVFPLQQARLKHFQSPIYRDYYCYLSVVFRCSHSLQLSVPYLSGLLLLLSAYLASRIFMYLSVPYLSGLLLLRLNRGNTRHADRTFSPLFIGIIIVTHYPAD